MNIAYRNGRRNGGELCVVNVAKLASEKRTKLGRGWRERRVKELCVRVEHVEEHVVPNNGLARRRDAVHDAAEADVLLDARLDALALLDDGGAIVGRHARDAHKAAVRRLSERH